MTLNTGLASYAVHQCSKTALATVSSDPLRAGSFRPARSDAETPRIPAPSLFGNLNDSNDPDHLPIVAQCAVHLEFLQVLVALEQRVINSNLLDRTFDLRPDIRQRYNYTTSRYENVRDRKLDNTFQQRRRMKWVFFVSAAATRFIDWWKRTPTISMMRLGDDNLPPLDILMIWHSFLLNPGMYEKPMPKARQPCSYGDPIPVESLHKAIKSDDWTFTLSASAAASYKQSTGCDPDLFSALCSEELTTSINSTAMVVTYEGEEPAFQKLAEKLNNPEPYLQLQLKEAFERQSKFAHKMGCHLWIRSPACAYTLEQACERYRNFLSLFKLYPKQLLVPTLDIDLVWHTHQLSARAYRRATEKICGRFIDHNDKLEQGSLDTGFTQTKMIYAIRFGAAYEKCMCWEDQALESLLAKDVSGANVEAIGKQAVEEVSYHYAVEVARRAGQTLPVR